NECSPACLMAGTKSGTGVPVEILMKRHVVAPVRVVLKVLVVAEHGPPATVSVVAHEDALQAIGKLVSHSLKRQEAPRTCRALDGKRVAVVPGRRGQCLDEQEVHREPDWAAPVRVTAEHAVVRDSRQICHGAGPRPRMNTGA